jgi:hypothetical protein
VGNAIVDGKRLASAATRAMACGSWRWRGGMPLPMFALKGRNSDPDATDVCNVASALALLARRLTAAEASPPWSRRSASPSAFGSRGAAAKPKELFQRMLFVEARRVARRLRVRPRTCVCPPSYSRRHDNRQVVDFKLGVQPNYRIRWAVDLRLGIRREPNCSTRRRARLWSQGRGQEAGRPLKVQSRAPGQRQWLECTCGRRAGGKEARPRTSV